jgi:transposase
MMEVMGNEIEFKAYEQHQGSLLPGFVGDSLDPADPVFFIDDVIEAMDLTAFEERYAAEGEHAYPPRLLLKLWLFGAIAGVYSGRELARRLYWDLRFRYLAGDLRPDFRTINRFRERHREDFAGVLRESIGIAQASGLARLGRVAIDGTKIRANTSRHKAMSHGRMEEAEAQLEDEIGQILAQMDELNAEEDDREGDGDGGGGLPEELRWRESRRERIRAARAQLEAEKGRKLESRHQKSFADPEANMMKTGEGSLTYCYNAQAATSEDGIVVATELVNTPNDAPELLPMLDAVRANTGQRPEVALADAGYLSEANLQACRRRRQRCLVAVGRETKKPSKWPKGKWTRRMHRTLRLPWARELYGHRKTQGERPFAEIKATMGFRRFALRGVSKVSGEWNLVCAAFNLKRITMIQKAAV